MKRLLLLSNSVNPGMGFLEHAGDTIKDFLGTNVKRVLFIPYAVVTLPDNFISERVGKRFNELGYELDSIHTADDPVAAVREAEAIAVSGGNTFHLLKTMYDLNLLDAVRERVEAGAPYMGWSAGSNLTCPTLKTTNDMPIAQPPSFDALGLIPFQINPHYTDKRIEGHGGEGRAQRIEEFIEVNRDVYVAGLREGSALRLQGDELTLIGDKPLKVFHHGEKAREIEAGGDVSFLLG